MENYILMKWIQIIVALLTILFLSACGTEALDTTINTAEEIAIWIEEELPNAIAENIHLPKQHPTLGGSISWQSSDESLLTNNGNILPGVINQEVTLTYTITIGSIEKIGEHTVLIVGMSVDAVAIAFENQFASVIVRDYTLITSYYDLFIVSWSSSHEEIFSNQGVYNAPFYDTLIQITYTVDSITLNESKIYEKEIVARSMNLIERSKLVQAYLNTYFNFTNILEIDATFPQNIEELEVTLSWEDANGEKLMKFSDVTTHIIPNVGVDLTVNVTTKDQVFSFLVRYQSQESNSTAQMRNIPSIDLIKEMRVGWNLGNTFDSPSEIAWGNPKTTKTMIDTIKSAGFNVLRIPVTWEGHFSGENYLIDEAWMNRVQEVINYAIDNNTFVIINMHHERWNSTSYMNKEQASIIMEKLWTQIGTRFSNYNEYLLFEGMNEPRIYEASDSIQWGGSSESFEVINHLNQVFVNTVRSLGGNNRYRHLMITTNGAGTSDAILSSLVVPNDPNVIVSLHSYAPYDFAHDKTTNTTWSKDKLSDTNPIDGVFDRIDRYFIQENIAVIMGEFASRDKNNIAARLAWLSYYLNKANERDIPCIWWDTGQVQTPDNMTFSIFNRRTSTWLFPEIVEMLMNKTA